MSIFSKVFDVARQFLGSNTHSTINPTKIVKVYFQCWPGSDAASGVENSAAAGAKTVKYTFTVDGTKVKDDEEIGAAGLVALPLPTGKSGTLEILGTKYNVTQHTMEVLTSKEGRQRRLNMLGYELDDVDGIFGPKTDRSIMNFQADDGTLIPDGAAGPLTRAELKTDVDDA